MSVNENNKPVALVLGGTSPHIELIKKMKNRGYYVILLDYLTNAPGISYADEYVCASTLDQEKVAQIAIEKKASVVISTCIDQANSTCCYVAEKLGLPKPYDYQTSLNVTDKGLMKKIMVDHEIPTSPYQIITEETQIDWNKVIYPAVVKPVDCNSSKGVHRADSKEEIIEYVNQAVEMSRSHHAVVEGFNAGPEIQVDCVVSDHTAHVVMTRQKKKIAGTNGMVMQSTGSVIPAPLNENQKKQAEEIAQKIASAFNLNNTPFFYQAIVTADGISVLEFAPRIGGGLSYYLLKNIAGADMVEYAVQSFLQEPIKIEKKEDNNYYSSLLLYMKAGIFDHISGFEQLKESGYILEHFQMKKSGTEIDSDMRSGNRVGAVVIQAGSYEELKEKEAGVLQQIQVFDKAGNDLLHRDFQIQE